MSIKEKAKEYAQNVPEHNHLREDAEGSFISGAKWAKSEVIRKAINWLENNADRFDRLDRLVNNFKKAMEE